MTAPDELSAATASLQGRLVAIGASRNFRHMGDYGAGEGCVTRADRLFRSDVLSLSNDRDMAMFRALGITQLFDFRTDAERSRQPLELPTALAVETRSLPIESGAMRRYLAEVAALEPAAVDCKFAMTRMYYEMLDVAASQLRAYFRALTEADGAMLVMCTTGKDRTGLACALLLSALGVSAPQVMQDYLLSAIVYRGHEEEFARRHGYEAKGHELARFRDVFTVHPEYLEAVWRRAAERAGDVASLLTHEFLDTRAQRILRERFTRRA
jgi:protein-tyrosine phosphatase